MELYEAEVSREFFEPSEVTNSWTKRKKFEQLCDNVFFFSIVPPRWAKTSCLTSERGIDRGSYPSHESMLGCVFGCEGNLKIGGHPKLVKIN